MSMTHTGGGYLYQITNTLNGIRYIGVTKYPKRRFKQHCNPKHQSVSLLTLAIQKHGAENFKMDLLCQSTEEYCYEMEVKAIKLFNTMKPNGYNITAGGFGYCGVFGENHPLFGKKRPPEIGLKIAEKLRGQTIPLEQRAKISASLTGKKASEEKKRKLSLSLKGIVRTLEWRQRLSESNKGNFWSDEKKARIKEMRKSMVYVPSEEQRKKQSEKLKANWADPVWKANMLAMREQRRKEKLACH